MAPALESILLRKTYDWLMHISGRPRAVWVLWLFGFAESWLFTMPASMPLVPMVLAARERAWRYAAVCGTASVVGGLVGYFIGAALFEIVGRPLLEFFEAMSAYEDFLRRYSDSGAWIVFVGAITPVAYKVVPIASGAVQIDLWAFVIALVVGRNLRYFVIAGLLWWFGPSIRSFIERRLRLVFYALAAAAALGVFVLLNFIN